MNYLERTPDPTLKPNSIFMLFVWIVLIIAVFRYAPSYPVKLNPPANPYELNGVMWHSNYVWGTLK